MLAEIKTDEYLKLIPVTVLTISNAEEDIVKAYSNEANCDIIKPAGFNDFIEIIRFIEHFWLDIVKLSPKEK